MFTDFRKEQPQTPGFYVLRYREGHEERVYLQGPRHHGGGVYSYFATYHNYRDRDTCHDMGQYVWCNSWHIHGPVAWRRMTPDEALAFSETLYWFGRPSWAHPAGRRHLTLADVA